MKNEDRTYFASEKKSILLAVKNDEFLDYKSLQHYLTYQFVPEPDTMHEGIHKLEPGHYFTKKIGSPMDIKRYWKAAFSASTKV